MRRHIRHSGIIALKGVIERPKAGGGLRRYLRSKGKVIGKLPDDIPMDSPEFLAAYAALVGQIEQPAESGTLGALVVSTKRTPRYKEISDSYRSMLARHFDAIRESYGKARTAGLRERHIAADVDSADNPTDRLKAWRFLCAHATARGLMSSDPSKGVTVAKAKTDGHPPWDAAEVAAFRTRWPIGTTKRAAFELLHWTGSRISDAVKLGPGMVDRDGVLAYRQTKTGGVAYCPWSCPLPPYAAQMDADRRQAQDAIAALPGGHMTFLATHAGRPRSEKALGTMIREAARDAGVQKSAHGLRKSRARSLAEAGATTHQIGAWTGHESLKEIEHYTVAANRRRAVMGTEHDQNSGTATNLAGTKRTSR